MSPQHYCWENRCTEILQGSVSRKDESLNQNQDFLYMSQYSIEVYSMEPGFGEIACSFNAASVYRWFFFPPRLSSSGEMKMLIECNK